MKKQLYLIGIVLIFLVEIATLVAFSMRTPDFSQDAVAVNEVVYSLKEDWSNLSGHKNNTLLNYVVIDNDGNVLFRTKSGLTENVGAAISHRDTVLDIEIDNLTVGKVIVFNDSADKIQSQRQTEITVLSVCICVEFLACVVYAAYLHHRIVKPFKRLKGFAERVAGGDLDIPLVMDRQNIFGAFTESFDIMRSELKKARLAEAQANASKKELVAKLSHDIKTPVASIKAVSEVGIALTQTQKDREQYTQIIAKADQVNTLVTNLFSATLEELEQLTVSPKFVESGKIKTLLENADYMHRAEIPDMPPCLVFVDELRLQQVFDNIFANSYKYANTEILVNTRRGDGVIEIEIEDFGGGVKSEELNIIKEKFKRGSSVEGIDGAGLGLYISDYFMQAMHGELILENGTHGLKVTLVVSLGVKI